MASLLTSEVAGGGGTSDGTGRLHKRKLSLLTSEHNVAAKDREDDEIDEGGSQVEHINLQEAVELQCAFVEIAERKRRTSNKVVQSKVIKLTSDGASWIVHISNYYTPPSKHNLFEETWRKHPKTRKCLGKLFGGKKECFENRYSQSYGVPFSYSGYKNDIPRPLEEDPILVELLAEINSAVRKDRGPYNGCLVNWYVIG
jgi:hypothetical protein